jgi:N-methylhydantoinase A
VFINESNGGVMTAHLAADHAIGTLLSGPVGGVTGTAALADVLGEPDLIAADVGGTSFDVSIVRHGRPTVRAEFDMQGLPVLAPSVEVHTLGAGGGSYITVDEVGRLRVGPESAGADPGPACYARGGTAPTVTDAHVVLGNIPGSQRLAGSLALDVEAARRVMAEPAGRLGLDAVDLAHQALEVVNFRMAEAIRELTTERGLDPRTFVLCCFGGAGGLHAAAIADELEIARVVIPHLPGSFSAAGMLQGGIQHDLVQAFFRDQHGAERDLQGAVDALRQRGLEMLRAERVAVDEAYVKFFVDVRYAGQEFSMTVPLREGAPFHVLVDDFQDLYHGRYGHSSPGAGIEVVAVRIRVGRHFDQRQRVDDSPTGGPQVEDQPVHFAGGWRSTPVHRRDDVVELAGPALIIESTATTVVPPDWWAERVAGGHLLLQRKEAA